MPFMADVFNMERRETRERQIASASQIDAALRSGTPVGLILVQRDAKDPALLAVMERAASLGIRVR
jgi:hypothetical protein